MKTDRKIKAKKSSPKLTADTKVRRAASKPASSNGKHPSATYEHTPIGIVESSLEGKHINVNEEFCRITGYEKRELLMGGIKEFTYEDDYPIDIKLHGQLIAGEIPFYRLEKRYVRKDGGIIWVELTRSVVRDAQGKPLYAIGVILDISERKHVERVLRESVERLRLATEAARMFTWEWDFQKQIYTLADNFVQVLGFSADLLPKNAVETIYKLSPAEDVKAISEAIAKAIESHNDLHSLQCRVINPENGQTVWLEVSAKIVYTHEGNPERMFGVAQNITDGKQTEEALHQLNLQLESRVQKRTTTIQAINQSLRDEIAERKKAEEALRKSEATARLLLNTAPDGVVIIDDVGVIVHANPQIADLFGYQPDEVLGKQIEVLIPERFLGQHMQHRHVYKDQRLKRTMGLSMDLFGRRKSGNEFPVDVMLTPISNIPGWDVMVTIRDDTERKEMESALRKSHERLQILSQRLVEVQEEERRALARELHDRVGQTLAALNINLIIIHSQLSADATQQIGTRLNDSMKLVADTIALVRDVMTDLRPAVLDDYGLEAALESHLDEFTSRYNIKAKLERPDRPIPRLGSSIEMTFLRIAQEALMNIARHARADHVHLSLRQGEDSISLTIQDNGVGIESWQEANRPGSHGLTIMRERAEAFGGSLRVKSVPGQGTKVEVGIPLKSQNEGREEKHL